MAAAITGQPVIAGKAVKQDREIRPGHPIKCLAYTTPFAAGPAKCPGVPRLLTTKQV
jgi:hypothetical protein